MFQFLIGRLDTECKVLRHGVGNLFQFLIGRLDTRGAGYLFALRRGFNSS